MTQLPEQPLPVAAIQAQATPGEVAENAAAVARLIRQAAQHGARLAVFPELFLPAYHPPVLLADPARCDLAADESGVVDDPRLDPIREASQRHDLVALVGASVRRPDGARRCSALLADGSGAVRAAYDKQHLCGAHERELFSPGDQGCMIRVDSWLLGVGICYDGCFPEHARAVARAGAHGYLCPSAYVTGSQHRRDLYYRARALDNTMYVVFANPVAGVDDWRFTGGAAVYDPQGRPVGKAADEGEAVLRVDLDPQQLSRTRAAQTMLADRRDDLAPESVVVADTAPAGERASIPRSG
ncbi:MAG: carbon-nitrogen hydrolase family protein [Micromonosporaceae bacterium]